MVNTCTVTGRADFSDRQAIRRIARASPDALLVVTGCYAQTDPDAVAAHAGRGPGGRQPGEVPAARPARLARQAPRGRRSRGGRRRATPASVPVAPLDARSAAARAPSSRSRTAASTAAPSASCRPRAAAAAARSPKVVARAGRARWSEAGYRGDHADRRGHRPLRLGPRARARAWPRWSARLARGPGPALAAAVLGAARPTSRRSSSRRSPTLAGRRAAPAPAAPERERPGAAAHAPAVQHAACTATLVERLAGAHPGLGLGADVIVGHPGRERRPTSRRRSPWSATLPFSYLHVFAYSDRKGTEAARLAGRVAPRGRSASAARRLRRARPREEPRVPARLRRSRRGRCWCSRSADRATGLLAGLTSQLRRGALRRARRSSARRFAPVRITEVGARPDARRAGGGGGVSAARTAARRAAPSASSAAAASTRWRGSRTSAGSKVRTPFGEPSDAYCVGRLRRPAGDLPAAARPRPPADAVASSTTGRTSGASSRSARAGSISVSAVGSMKEDDPPARPGRPRPVLRPHPAPRLVVLRRGHRGATWAWPTRCARGSATSLETAGREAGARVHRGRHLHLHRGPAVLDQGRVAASTAAGASSVIGMTNMPEAKLAREAELCYATLALATDYDVWHESHDAVTRRGGGRQPAEERGDGQGRPAPGDPAGREGVRGRLRRRAARARSSPTRRRSRPRTRKHLALLLDQLLPARAARGAAVAEPSSTWSASATPWWTC